MITDEMVEQASKTYWQKHWHVFGDANRNSVKETMRAALSAALSVETRVKVRELEWTAEDNGEFIAVSAVGWYHIGFPARSWNLTMPSGEVPSFGDDLEAAKAAAQADYSARILSALSVEQPTPQQHVSMPEAAVEEAAKLLCKWIGYAWDGAGETDRQGKFPDWVHNSYGGLSLQGGKPALRRIAAQMLACAPSPQTHAKRIIMNDEGKFDIVSPDASRTFAGNFESEEDARAALATEGKV